LLASALVLHDGVETQVQVALDLLMLDAPTARSVRRAVAVAMGIDERFVFVSCTHTHSGPVTVRLLAWDGDVAMPPPDLGYIEMVRGRVVEAVREAKARMQPAAFAWTTADARGVGGNRHAPDGVTDPEAGLLAVRAGCAGPFVAVALVYGMHPTVLHEDSRQISSDFPHYARLEIQRRLGRHVVVLYHNGPCGNQSPRYCREGRSFVEAERLGRKLGSATVAAITSLLATAFSSECRLDGRLCPVRLVRRRLASPDEAERLLAESRAAHARLVADGAERARVRTAECAVFGAEGALKLARAAGSGELDRLLEAYDPIEICGLLVGDTVMIGLPGEWFVEYGLAIKRSWPCRAFVASFVGGELQGYLVTPEAARAGGYETAWAPFDPASGAVAVDAAVAMIEDLLRVRNATRRATANDGGPEA
jgi:hypothetical protein